RRTVRVALQRRVDADPDRRSVLAHVALLGLEGIDLAGVEPLAVVIGAVPVIGMRDVPDAPLEELLSGIPEHLAQLPVHVDETSVDADVADAERRELDRARIALLALAKPPHRLGLRIEVTDLDREPVNDLQETLVRLRDAARAEVEDADRPAARQDRKEECVFPAGALQIGRAHV